MKDFNSKYTIRDFIDKNKWSNVYLAINKETNKKVILNVLINVNNNESNLDNFIKEINKLKNINSRNVISINEISTYINKEKTYYYIESEYFDGLTLDELMRVNKLNYSQCLQIIKYVIQGVKEFNNEKINFDTLNYENIIINGDGLVKIDILSFINNHKGHVNCKIHDTKKFDAHEDVYVIGSILCEMITGKKIFDADEYKIFDKNLSEILVKSTNKKNISKHSYRDLNEFLHDVNLYLDGKEINSKEVINEENYNKSNNLNFNSKINKSIIIACSVIVLLCTTAFGAQYLIKKNNIASAKTNETISQSEETSNSSTHNLKPPEENLITSNDKSETKENTNNDENKFDSNVTQDDKDKEDNDVNNQHNNNHNNDDDSDKEDNNDKNDSEDSDKEDNDKDNPNKDDNEENTDNDKNDHEEDNNDNNNSNEDKVDNDNSNEENEGSDLSTDHSEEQQDSNKE